MRNIFRIKRPAFQFFSEVGCYLARVKKVDLPGAVGPSCPDQVANLSLPRTMRKKEFNITQDFSCFSSSGRAWSSGSEGEITFKKLRHWGESQWKWQPHGPEFQSFSCHLTHCVNTGDKQLHLSEAWFPHLSKRKFHRATGRTQWRKA